MKTTTNPPNDWDPCASGLLTSIGSRAKSRKQRRRTALRAGLSAAVVVMVVGVAVWSGRESGSDEENFFGGIACHEVAEHLNAYAAGTVPDDLRSKIEVHLQSCARCQKAMRAMNAAQAVWQRPAAHPACDCPECHRRQLLVALRSSAAADGGIQLVSLDSSRASPAN